MPGHRITALGATLVLTVSLVAPTAGQSAGEDGGFEAVLAAARDETQVALDAANLASEEGATDMSPEQWAMGPLAGHLPTSVAELRAYAETLGSLDPPAAYRDDVAAHVQGLRSTADALAVAAEAGSAGDVVAVQAGYAAAEDLLADLASQVSPEYFDLAFVSPVRQRFAAFKSLTPEDQAYLDGIRAARRAFQARVDGAFQDVGPFESYASPGALMQAFYEAGAGEALPATEAEIRALTPSERFADEHAWLLLHAAEDSRLDRLIGEAARAGDAVTFWSIDNRLRANHELGEAGRIYPELDPAFGEAYEPGSPLAATLDTATPVGRDAYGLELFDVLRNYAWTDASAIAAGTFSLPATPLSMQLEVLAINADMIEDAWSDFESRMTALEAPFEFAADHARILGYVEEQGALLGDLLEAGRTGDPGAVFPVLEDMRQSFCSASTDLSDGIAPATSVYFDETLPLCR
jgi:hypothetical protein